MGNPTCIHSVPPSHTSWPWFSAKLVVNWKSFIDVAGLWTKYLTEQLKSSLGLCKKTGKNICQGEEGLQAQFGFVSLHLEQMLKTKKATQCNWEGCGRGKDVCYIATKGKVATAWWCKWAGSFNSCKCSHSYFSMICPEVLSQINKICGGIAEKALRKSIE